MSAPDILLAIFGFACVIADIVSADRALYHRMQEGGAL